MKKIKYFKFTYIRYLILLFLLEFVLSLSLFFLISNSASLLEKYTSYDDASLYILNDCNNVDRYMQENSIISYYAYDYKLIDDEYHPVLYMNMNAFKTGYLYHDFSVSLLIFSFKDVEIKQDIIYNSISKEEKNYLDFFDNVKTKDLFYTLDIAVPYICVSDAYFETNAPTDMIIKNYRNEPKQSYVTNEKYVATAEGLRQDFLSRNMNMISMILLLGSVPILLSSVSIVSFLILFFNAMKKDIVLNRIFYLKYNTLRKNYFIETISMVGSSTTVSFLISFLIFPISIQYFFIVLLISLGIEVIILWGLSSKYTKNRSIQSIDENNFYEV